MLGTRETHTTLFTQGQTSEKGQETGETQFRSVQRVAAEGGGPISQ